MYCAFLKKLFRAQVLYSVELQRVTSLNVSNRADKGWYISMLAMNLNVWVECVDTHIVNLKPRLNLCLNASGCS